jgi:hypothetical protein
MTIGKFAKKMQSQKKKNNNLIMANCHKSSNEDTKIISTLILIYHSFSQGKYKTASRKLSKRLCQCPNKDLLKDSSHTETGMGLSMAKNKKIIIP